MAKIAQGSDEWTFLGALFLGAVLLYKYVISPAAASAPAAPALKPPSATSANPAVNPDMGGQDFGVTDPTNWDG